MVFIFLIYQDRKPRSLSASFRAFCFFFFFNGEQEKKYKFFYLGEKAYDNFYFWATLENEFEYGRFEAFGEKIEGAPCVVFL